MQTLTFSPKEHPVAFVTTLALVLMPLTYAARVRMSMQRKADNYKADIDEMLLMRQRSSNTGAPPPPPPPATRLPLSPSSAAQGLDSNCNSGSPRIGTWAVRVMPERVNRADRLTDTSRCPKRATSRVLYE